MKKLHTLLFGCMIVALAVLVGVTRLPAPAEAGTHQQGDEEIGTQDTYTYLTIAGETFVPDSSNTVFAWQSGGGVAVTGGTNRYMHAPVILPDGATLHSMKFLYYDNTGTGFMTARLHRQNHAGSETEMALVGTSTGGYNSGSDTPDIAYRVVDNDLYSYKVEVYWSAASTNLRLMGVRIYYSVP